MINQKEVEQFYDLLGHKKQTEIRALALDKDFKPIQDKAQVFFVSTKKDFVNQVKKLNGKYNLYAGLNERKPNCKEAKDVISVKNIFQDIDVKNKPASDDDLIEAGKVAMDIISNIEKDTGIKPTCIMSGNGYQLIYSIPEIKITDSNREHIQAQIQEFTSELIEKYSNDKVKLDQVGDLPRIIRITGTTNIKGGKVSKFIEVNKEENHKLKDYILNLKPSVSVITKTREKIKDAELQIKFNEILESDERIRKLYNGDFTGYDLSVGGELALVCFLIQCNFDKKEVFSIMASAKIGRWNEKNLKYRNDTYKKAIEKISEEKRNVDIKEVVEKKPKNPFTKMHYSTDHLPFFHEFSNLVGLYGRHYIPILKTRWYQLHGGIIQKKIKIGGLKTDTRVHACYPLVTEGGKNDIIYVIKRLIDRGITKEYDKGFTCSEPISFHQESLIGKSVERLQDNPDPKGKPKKIKVRVENKGHLANDFIEFDECNQLINSNSPEFQQAREYLSKAENPMGTNKVEKRSVDDLPEETISYYPHGTHSYYFQPFTKLPESFVLQGFGRRKIIPVGNISLFLNTADEILYSDKLQNRNFNDLDYQDKLIKHLELARTQTKQVQFTFTEKALEMIRDYSVYISAQAQLHSEKIYNFSKISKWTSLGNLVKLSSILASSHYTNVVDERFVSLAYMDLVELMQNTFDFISERIIGDFDYGTTWGGADYKEKEALRYLYDTQSFNRETSKVSISAFEDIIMEIYKIKDTQAGNRYRDMKKKGLIDSAQVGTNDSRVWLKINPDEHKTYIEGDKGYKGYTAYNNVFLTIKDILTPPTPLQPLQPLDKEIEVKKIK